MWILDSARMRMADRIAIERMQIPSLVLMENAGRSVAAEIQAILRLGPCARVAVACGPGNNGGDGFVAARHLKQAGLTVDCALVGARLETLRGDAAAMAGAWRGIGGALIEIGSDADLDSWCDTTLQSAELIVDALFGTGLSRPLEGIAARVVERINATNTVVVSIDLPSGIDADGSAALGPAVRAAHTLTLAAPKPALLFPPAAELAGRWRVVSIGLPDEAIEATHPDLLWIDSVLAQSLRRQRRPEEHKGSFGHALVVAGSPGKAGAAALAGGGALRGGAGLVTLAVPEPIRPEAASFFPELMTEPLPATKEGTLARGAVEVVADLLRSRDVIAIGPGLGQDHEARQAIRQIVRDSDRPLVLDADGLNSFAADLARLASRRAPAVLTPHPGEAARLLGVSSADIAVDRLGSARRLAQQADAVCLLKGHQTLIARPDGRVAINSTGNAGMASGGMGDLLTGLIAALLAQGLDPFDAAMLGAHLHGLAGDLAVEHSASPESLVASDLLPFFSVAFRQLEGRSSRSAQQLLDDWESA